MAGRSGPSIVHDGLVLGLDAADKVSYLGSGTTWSDLSPNGYDGTLSAAAIGTVSSSLKTMAFNGSAYVEIDDAKDLVAVTVDWSVSLWFKLNALGTGNNQHIFSQQIGVDDRMAICQNGTGAVISCTVDESTYYHQSETITANTWHHVMLVWDTDPSGLTGYLDGSAMTGTSSVNTIGGATGIDIGRQVGAQAGTYMAGTVANVQIYNRTLSAKEASQNFNAQRSRFGV